MRHGCQHGHDHLVCGTKGKRYSLPHSTIHMHPAIGGARGSGPDVEIQARELSRMQQLGRQLMSNDTGQSVERIARDFDRDLFMTPEQAKDYGIIDGYDMLRIWPRLTTSARLLRLVK